MCVCVYIYVSVCLFTYMYFTCAYTCVLHIIYNLYKLDNIS